MVAFVCMCLSFFHLTVSVMFMSNFMTMAEIPISRVQFSTQFRTGYTSESVVIYMNASGCIS